MLWTSYRGVEVLQSDQVQARHPRFGFEKYGPNKDKFLVLEGASLLALADETFVVVCDCGYNGLTGDDPYVKPEVDTDVIPQINKIMAHQRSTHLRKAPRKLYSDEDLVLIIKVFLQHKATHRLNWASRAVEELENMGIKPARGEHWNTDQLSGLVRHYLKDPKYFNAVKAALLASRSKSKPAPQKQTIAGQKTAASSDIQKEAAVPASTADPILTFATEKQPAPVTLLEKPAVVIPQQYPQHPIQLTVPPVDKLVVNSAYEHITEQDGEPVFMYNGQLMVGKKVRFVVSEV